LFSCTPQVDSSSYLQPNTYTLPTLVETPKLDISSGKFREDAQQNQLFAIESGKPSLSIKITKSKTAENTSDANKQFTSTNAELEKFQQVAQIPPSFAIAKDNSHTPLAQPTPTTNSIHFGGLDDNFQQIDFLEELERLPKKSQRKWVKF
jgi:hypothetical protein